MGRGVEVICNRVDGVWEKKSIIFISLVWVSHSVLNGERGIANKSLYYHRCQHQRTKKRDRADEKA